MAQTTKCERKGEKGIGCNKEVDTTALKEIVDPKVEETY